MKRFFFLFSMIIILPYTLSAQIMNKHIEAIINVQQENDIINIFAMAQNKTDITTSIDYKLSVIKNDVRNNQSTNNQNGSKVIESFQKINLSKVSVNTTPQERIIILLLIYDANKKIIGNSRYVYNDYKDQDSIKKELFNTFSQQKENTTKAITPSYEKISFKGIVVDETKTKAGKDFYQLYYTNYLSQNINSEHIITITESITMGNNTKIAIQTGGNIIYEFFVQTKYDFLKSMSETTLRITIKYLEHLKLNQQRIQIY